jgi:chemotaxis protein MotA
MLKKILPLFIIILLALLFGTVTELASVYINLKSNIIILSGTLLCCFISYPPSVFKELFKSISQAFSKNTIDLNRTIEEIQQLASVRRIKGVVELDKKSRKIKNQFLKMGIEMVVDEYDRYTIFKTLERRYDSYLENRQSQGDLINSMIKLLPVFGFIGTIIGLINVLNHMTSPEMIGKGVATALLTTFYGLLYANILCLPIAKKLIERTKQESAEVALIIEGILDISENRNSKAIGYRLRYCVSDLYQSDQQLKSSVPSTVGDFRSLKLNLKKQFTAHSARR